MKESTMIKKRSLEALDRIDNGENLEDYLFLSNTLDKFLPNPERTHLRLDIPSGWVDTPEFKIFYKELEETIKLANKK
jgi:hypothetical protein